MNRPIAIALVTAGLVGAFALGSRQRGGASTSPAPTSDVRPSITLPSMHVASTTVEGAPGLSAEQIRSIVREELSATRGEPAAEIDPEVTAIAENAFARGEDLIERARGAQRWTEADRDQLRVVMSSIDREQAEVLFSELYPALNDGRISLAYQGSPL